MLKDHPGPHGVPHRSDRIIVSPASAGGFQCPHEILIGQSLSTTHGRRSRSPNGSISSHETKVRCGIMAIRVHSFGKCLLNTSILPQSGPFFGVMTPFFAISVRWGQFSGTGPVPPRKTACGRAILGENFFSGVLQTLSLQASTTPEKAQFRLGGALATSLRKLADLQALRFFRRERFAIAFLTIPLTSWAGE